MDWCRCRTFLFYSSTGPGNVTVPMCGVFLRYLRRRTFHNRETIAQGDTSSMPRTTLTHCHLVCVLGNSVTRYSSTRHSSTRHSLTRYSLLALVLSPFYERHFFIFHAQIVVYYPYECNR